MPGLRVLQLIVTALVLGVLIFAAVALGVAPAGSAAGGAAVLRYVAIGTVVVAVPVALGIRRLLIGGAAGGRPNPFASPGEAGGGEDPAAAQQFTVATIAGAAVLEGAALLGVIVYLMSGNHLDLVIAGVPLAVLVAVFFPTGERWRRKK